MMTAFGEIHEPDRLRKLENQKNIYICIIKSPWTTENSRPLVIFSKPANVLSEEEDVQAECSDGEKDPWHWEIDVSEKAHLKS